MFKEIQEMSGQEVVDEIKQLMNRDTYFDRINDMMQTMSSKEAYILLEERAASLGLNKIFSSVDSFYMSRSRHVNQKRR